MTAEPKDEDRLRDSEIAIIDTLKMLMEILTATGTVRAEVFERVFAQARDGYIAKAMPNAAVIMEVLRGFAARPANRPDRDLSDQLNKPPQGSA